MSVNNESEHYFLWVGRTKNNRLTKLYIGKGNPADPICPLWREVSKKQLDGDTEQQVREAAKALAEKNFDSPEDLFNKSRDKEFKMNIPRGLKEGPTRWFIVDPWAK